MLIILYVRFDMMKKRLISSYDEKNDTFVGKLQEESGYYVDYEISDGIYMGINNFNLPSAIFIPNASKVLNISKSVLESPDVLINIKCDDISLSFKMFIENLKIFSAICRNNFDIPNINYEMDSNF